MNDLLPAPVLEADAIHHGILRRIAFSQHLNPTNADEARHAFRAGSPAPPFVYKPLTQADDILRALDRADPPRDHPAGALVGRALDGTRLMVRALRDRTAAAFDALAHEADWYPTQALLDRTFEDQVAPPQTADVSSDRMIATLRAALADRGLDDWRVIRDEIMAARVLVDGAKRMLRVNPRARFHSRDLTRLVVHEIDVHAVRAANGQRQPLRCFETGLPGSLVTEEGLAMVAEHRAGVASPGVLQRQLLVVRAIHRARDMGFREVHDELADLVGPGLAWGICLRIKRGLGRPELPGVYAKDSVYLQGFVTVDAWLRDGGDIASLYVGKVSVHDPVAEWVDAGWVEPAEVPRVWRRTA